MISFLKRIEEFVKNHQQTLLIISILLLGVSLRIYRLINHQGFWFDELVVADLAQRPLSEMLHFLQFENNPPFYFIIMHFWGKFFGVNELGFRSFSLIFSLFSFWPIYKLAKNFFNEKIAALSIFILAIAPYPMHFGTEARMYSLLFFLFCSIYYFFYRATQTNLNKYWLICFFLISLALYTHLTALLIFPSLLFFLIFTKPIKEIWIKAWSTALASLISFSPWLIIFSLKKITEYNDQLFTNNWYSKLKSESPVFIVGPIGLIFKSGYYFLENFPVIAFINSLLVILPLLYIIYIYKTSQYKKSIFQISLFLIPTLITASLTNIAAIRYHIVILPTLIISLAVGIYSMYTNSNLKYKNVISLLLSVYVICATFASYQLNNVFEKTGELLNKNGVSTVLSSPTSAIIKYYQPSFNLEYLTISEWGQRDASKNYIEYILKYNWNWNKFSDWSLSDQRAIENAINAKISKLNTNFAFVQSGSITDKQISDLLDSNFCQKKFYNSNLENFFTIYYKNIKLSDCAFESEIVSYPQ